MSHVYAVALRSLRNVAAIEFNLADSSCSRKEKTPGTFYFLEHELSARLNSIAATFLKLLSATAYTWLIRPW